MRDARSPAAAVSDAPSASPTAGAAAPPPALRTLAEAAVGFRGRIHAVRALAGNPAIEPEELERRLLELGFAEGETVEVLHQGLFGRDPIALRIAGTTIALRRREAAALLVEALPDGAEAGGRGTDRREAGKPPAHRPGSAGPGSAGPGTAGPGSAGKDGPA
ncbi:ferrous iron transport protein A [Roseomonas sp. NAR14]|uniref:Ferrous iron transport protein A n=1 Tax=Roseomonas acroporae TaxID=2937791 RepID=A0A9X1Y8P6_9PROT|nr:FeoA family protein [Roseomonas acroporae]MCK8785125.1 ferrous iron transport protein A [Roseomonas acroporae]